MKNSNAAGIVTEKMRALPVTWMFYFVSVTTQIATETCLACTVYGMFIGPHEFKGGSRRPAP